MQKRQITTQIFRPAAKPALEFARIAYESFHFEPHFHDHYVMMLVENGVNLGRRCRENYTVVPGEMLLIQPGEVHTGSAFENKTLRYLAFYPDPNTLHDCLVKIGHRPSSAPGFSLKYQHPVLRHYFRQMFEVVLTEGNEPLATETAVLEFFETLMQTQPEHSGPIQPQVADSIKVKKAQDFIKAHFDTSFSLDELAASIGTNPFHTIRLFRRHIGLTPFEYLRSFRVERAKTILRSKKSLTEVAYQSGFYDQSHFIRSFKKHTGFLPSAFRNH